MEAADVGQARDDGPAGTPGEAARLVLVCGLPGAGKTTLARRLEREMPALRLCPDEWMARLEMDLYDEPARQRVEALCWEMAQAVLRLERHAILENGFWSREERDTLRRFARERGYRVELRALVVPLEELWRRVAQRNESGVWATAPITRAQLEEWARWFRVPDAAELAQYDSPLVP